MMLAKLLLFAFYLYLLLGGFFGIWFVFRGAERIDPNLHGASWRTRLLLLPGSAAFWVILLVKWIKSDTHGS